MVHHRVRATGAALVDGLREPRDPPPRPPGRLLRTAVLLAAGILVASGVAVAGEVVDLGRTGAAVAPLLGAAAGLPLLLALRRPLVGWALSAASALLVTRLPLLDADPWPWPVPHGFALLGLLFAVSARETPARAVAAWTGTALLVVLTVRVDLGAGWATAVTAVTAAGVLAGRLGRANRRLARESVLGEQEKARRLVLEERTRIARELHDVVAHHMSLVAVRTETAPYRVGELSDGAREELAAIGDAARAALDETRTLLTVLRRDAEPDDDGPGTDRAPQPDLGRLPALLEAARGAGLQVRADVDGCLGDLRLGTSLAAYRIIAEALANAARHAYGAPVHLAVHRDEHALSLCVSNGPPAGATRAGPPGHGIVGMGERARAAGGRLTATPTADGGFTVEARLPVGARR